VLTQLKQFARSPLVFAVATLLAVASMLRYPGGTPLDHSRPGYSLARNFLSDLGMTVAYNGERNWLGALLFIIALAMIVVGAGFALFMLAGRCTSSLRGRTLARWASASGLVACFAFLGVALTPENRLISLHIGFTQLGFYTAPFVTLLLAFALKASNARSSLVLVMGILTFILAGFVALLQWGPSWTTPDGLMVHVVAQKLVATSAVATLIFVGLQDRSNVNTRQGA
jgi:hypothetical protein